MGCSCNTECIFTAGTQHNHTACSSDATQSKKNRKDCPAYNHTSRTANTPIICPSCSQIQLNNQFLAGNHHHHHYRHMPSSFERTAGSKELTSLPQVSAPTPSCRYRSSCTIACARPSSCMWRQLVMAPAAVGAETHKKFEGLCCRAQGIAMEPGGMHHSACTISRLWCAHASKRVD
jgi:hypothetical protein